MVPATYELANNIVGAIVENSNGPQVDIAMSQILGNESSLVRGHKFSTGLVWKLSKVLTRISNPLQDCW